MKTPKEQILKKLQLLLLRLPQKHPKHLEESSRYTAAGMLNLYLSEAIAAAPEVEVGSWPKPLVEEDAGAGVIKRVGTKDQIATKAREILKLLAGANLAEKSAAAAAAPAAGKPAS